MVVVDGRADNVRLEPWRRIAENLFDFHVKCEESTPQAFAVEGDVDAEHLVVAVDGRVEVPHDGDDKLFAVVDVSGEASAFEEYLRFLEGGWVGSDGGWRVEVAAEGDLPAGLVEGADAVELDGV